MPTLFHAQNSRWYAQAMNEACGALSLSPPSYVALGPSDGRDRDRLLIVRIEANRGYALLVPNDLALLHNGQPIVAGLRVLAHRDALSVRGGATVYFSTEAQARIETFEGTAAISCPRCRSRIEAGEAIVRCPGCGVVHHEAPERNCWTYSETCAACKQPSALDAGLQWTPEAL